MRSSVPPSSAYPLLCAAVLALLPGALSAQSGARPLPRSVEHILPVAASVAAPEVTPPAGSPLVVLGENAADAPIVDGAADGTKPVASAPAPAVPVPVAAAPAPVSLTASVAREIFGVSGALRAVLVRPNAPVEGPLLEVSGVPEGAPPRWVPLHGTTRGGLAGEPVFTGQVVAPESPGVWRLEHAAGEYAAARRSLTLITPMPFDRKRDGRLNGYHIGRYPTEGSMADGVYAPPEAFIEITPANQDLQVSEHFRLRQFLTKDQFDVWPKYLALNLRLVDKLELVLQELNAMGVRAMNLHVMSGFRTPQYNGPGGDGRATLSRHMYGDAADIWVDGDNDGYIDDLNGDGRHDIRDAAVLLRAVERVEQKYPELTGGAGLYESNSSHGPYVHVDVRGSRARW